MKKFILIPALLLICSNSFAQQYLDSLASIWQDETQQDTIRLNALNEFAYSAVAGSYGFVIRPDSLLILANEMCALAKDIGAERYQADARIQQSRSYLFMGNPEKGLESALQAVETAEGMAYPYGLARALALAAVAYNMQGNQTEALENFSKSYEIGIKALENDAYTPIYGEIKAFPLKKMIYAHYNTLGELYRKLGSYNKALEYYEIGLKNYIRDGDKLMAAAMQNNIALVYNDLAEYEKAMEYFEEALLVFEAFDNKEFQGNALGNMANIYMKWKSYDKAEALMIRNLEIREETGIEVSIARAHLPLINLNIDRKEYGKAMDQIVEIETVFIENNAQTELLYTYYYKGIIYMEQGRFRDATSLFEKCQQMSNKMHILDLEVDAVNYLYQVYKKSGQAAKALEYHEELLVLTDSLNKDEAGKKLLQLEFSKKSLTDSLVQVEEKNRLQLAYEKELLEETNTRNIFVATGLILLIVSGGLWNRLNFTRKSRKIIETERDRSESLLLNILPQEVAEELKQNGEAKARDFEMVTVLFTDFKGFTQASEILSANELVDELNYFFKGFDRIMEKYGIEKIKTIGDAYMAVGGLHGNAKEGATKTTRAALEMQDFVMVRKKEKESQGLQGFDMRVGLHSGHVVAGIVGVKKFQYDIWGDTVNTASRMESAGQVGKVNISQTTYELISEDNGFSFTSRGKIEAKGKGEMPMYFVSV